MIERLLFPMIAVMMLSGCSDNERNRDADLARFYPEFHASKRAEIHEALVAGTIEYMTDIMRNSDVYDFVCNADRVIELVRNTEKGIWGEFPVLVGAVYMQRKADNVTFAMISWCDLGRDIKGIVLSAPIDHPQYRQLKIFLPRPANHAPMLDQGEIFRVKRVPMESLLARAQPSPNDPTVAIIEETPPQGPPEIPESDQLMAFVINSAGFRSNGVRVMEVRVDTEGGKYTRVPFEKDISENYAVP